MRPNSIRAAVFVMAALATGCGGGGGSCLDPANIAGDWTGTASGDSVARGTAGTVQASFLTQGCAVTGTNWTFIFPEAPELNRNLTVTGTAETSGISLNLMTDTTCSFQATGALVGAAEITGNYVTTANCSESESGAFDIRLVATPTATPVFTPTPTP